MTESNNWWALRTWLTGGTLAASLLLSACNDSDDRKPGVDVPEDDGSPWSQLNVSPPVQDPSGLEEQISTQIAAMTLEEKVGQMVMPEIQHVTPQEIADFNIGSVLNGGGSYPGLNKQAGVADWLSVADALFNASLASTSGIPLLWGTDAVHGHSNVYGATLFPHNIGLGAARDEDLLYRIGLATGAQLRVTGQDWNFAPTVAVARDDRWGRTYESYSEDPELVRAYADDMVRGLQGNLAEPGNVIATVKHFLGDGGTTDGVDQGNTEVDEATLAELHGAGFFSALEAGAQSVMVSFNSWNGEKLHGQRYLITDVLKGRLKFDGIVVSDWNGHGQVTGCTNSNCAQAVNAGIDVFMVPYAPEWKDFIATTVQQVRDGLIPESRIDDAVSRVLRVKHRYGLFQALPPSQRTNAGNAAHLASAETRALAREAVRKSLVLLKNANGVLPIERATRVLVAGKSANNLQNQTGGWSLTWQGTDNTNDDFPVAESIWRGISAIAPNATLDETGESVNPQLHDVAIVVIGETPYAEGIGDIRAADTLEHARRYPEDRALIERIQQAGVPVVTVFVSGRPAYVNPELNMSEAFVAAWLPGTEGGGVADVLFRDGGNNVAHDMTGRLSFSWPGEPCATPLNLGDENYAPLFAYGYGLSYGEGDTLGSSLPQPERKLGCGRDETDGGGDGATTPLSLFDGQNYAPWSFMIGDPSNWGGVNVATSTSSVTALENISVVPVDGPGGIQWAAMEATVSSTAQVYIQAETETDLSAYLNGDGALVFDLRVLQAPESPVALRVDCVYPCIGEIDATGILNERADGEWHSVTLPLDCFSNAGTDFSMVDTPFLMFTEGALRMQLANIRWEPQHDGVNTCDG